MRTSWKVLLAVALIALTGLTIEAAGRKRNIPSVRPPDYTVIVASLDNPDAQVWDFTQFGAGIYYVIDLSTTLPGDCLLQFSGDQGGTWGNVFQVNNDPANPTIVYVDINPDENPPAWYRFIPVVAPTIQANDSTRF